MILKMFCKFYMQANSEKTPTRFLSVWVWVGTLKMPFSWDNSFSRKPNEFFRIFKSIRNNLNKGLLRCNRCLLWCNRKKSANSVGLESAHKVNVSLDLSKNRLHCFQLSNRWQIKTLMWSVNYALKALHTIGSCLVCKSLGELFFKWC